MREFHTNACVGPLLHKVHAHSHHPRSWHPSKGLCVWGGGPVEGRGLKQIRVSFSTSGCRLQSLTQDCICGGLGGRRRSTERVGSADLNPWSNPGGQWTSGQTKSGQPWGQPHATRRSARHPRNEKLVTLIPCFSVRCSAVPCCHPLSLSLADVNVLLWLYNLPSGVRFRCCCLDLCFAVS